MIEFFFIDQASLLSVKSIDNPTKPKHMLNNRYALKYRCAFICAFLYYAIISLVRITFHLGFNVPVLSVS